MVVKVQLYVVCTFHQWSYSQNSCVKYLPQNFNSINFHHSETHVRLTFQEKVNIRALC